jgi:hypothetical protein
LQVYVDDFTLATLRDMAREHYNGNLSGAARDILMKSLAEWDDKNARIVGENC